MSPPVEAATADHVAIPDADESEAPEAPLLEHAYDGIREYDNPLPGWWRAIFWGSIVFAASYWIWFHVAGYGTSNDAKYRAALADYQGKREMREAAEAANTSEDQLARAAQDPNIVAHGAEIFAARCASCHDKTGHGLIGPNLTDEFQIHGSSRMDIYQTVRGGAPGTAMPAWGEQLSGPDVVAAAAYAITLRGQDLPGKEPQGARVEKFK